MESTLPLTLSLTLLPRGASSSSRSGRAGGSKRPRARGGLRMFAHAHLRIAQVHVGSRRKVMGGPKGRAKAVVLITEAKMVKFSRVEMTRPSAPPRRVSIASGDELGLREVVPFSHMPIDDTIHLSLPRPRRCVRLSLSPPPSVTFLKLLVHSRMRLSPTKLRARFRDRGRRTGFEGGDEHLLGGHRRRRRHRADRRGGRG